MARRLAVVIDGDSTALERALGQAGKASEGFGSKISGAAKVASAALIGGLAVAAKVGFGELQEAQKVTAQTEAVLKSTAGAANLTAKQIEDLASSLSKMSGVDDEAIQSGENLLLTFTNIRNEVGKGNDVFDQATKTMLDMSVALGQDMKSSAIQLGKALNDPKKGLTALQRVGVSFTESQKKLIERLVESGDTMGAQKLILKELNKEFGGSAEAAGKTLPGQLAKAKNAFEEMAAGMVEALLPAFTKLAELVSAASGFLSRHKTLTLATAVALGTTAVSILAVNTAMKAFRAAMLVATAAQVVFNVAARANPYVAAATAIAAFVAGLVVLEKKFGILSAAVGAVREAFEGAFNWLKGNWPEIATIIAGPFAPIVALATDAFGIRSAFVNGLTTVKNWAKRNWPEIATILSGPFAPIVALGTDAFGIRSTIVGAFKAALTGVRNLFNEARTAAFNFGGRILSGMKEGIVGFVSWIETRLTNGIQAIKDAFGNAFSAASNFGGKILSGVKDGVSGLVGWLGDKLGDAVTAVANKVDNMYNKAKLFGSALFDGIKDMTKGLGGFLVDVARSGINALIRAWNNFRINFPGFSLLGFEIIPKFTIDFPDIPELAKGGIVTKATLAMIGEAGPEAVIPLSRSRAMGAARPGTVIHVNFHGPVYGAESRQLAIEVRNELVRMGRWNDGGILGAAV